MAFDVKPPNQPAHLTLPAPPDDPALQRTQPPLWRVIMIAARARAPRRLTDAQVAALAAMSPEARTECLLSLPTAASPAEETAPTVEELKAKDEGWWEGIFDEAAAEAPAEEAAAAPEQGQRGAEREDKFDELAALVKTQLSEWGEDYKEWCELYIFDSVPFSDNPVTHQQGNGVVTQAREADDKKMREAAHAALLTRDDPGGDPRSASPGSFYTSIMTGGTLTKEGSVKENPQEGSYRGE